MTELYKKQIVIAAMMLVFVAGCAKDHLDPSQIGRFRPAPAVNVILDTLGVAEEVESAYAGAEEPKPVDVVTAEHDYTFNSGDIVRISIFELLQEGTSYVDDYIVTESGNISIPEIGQIQTTGLTETQLEDEIRNALSPGILKNPSVTVTLRSSTSRMFSILGDGVAQPNRYPIPRYDFRLLDALAVAGSARQFNVSYIYVTRKITGLEQSTEQFSESGSVGQFNQPNPKQIDENYIDMPEKIGDDDLMEVIEPSFTSTGGGLVISAAEMDNTGAVGNGQEQIEWVFKDGKWVPVAVGSGIADEKISEPEPMLQLPQSEPQIAQQQPTEQMPADYGWQDIQSGGVQSRVIKIPKDKLYGGDPKYNIIIKPQDTITAELDIVGEFYVLGNVNNQGIINLTGRPMTLKMAIAAAGGLGPLAWPKKCEVIRRVGEKKEEIVMVDLQKIAEGTQPDFFIKPNDVINVGTSGVSRWMATLRNAFRATYGFGFIYDRNFASRATYNQVGDLLSNW